ncbi:hypothetical protein QFZ72_000125 [Bacillus sp. V2I10]|nr:hypothetical protein [Bacillus sp. V2I10]
MIIGSKAGEQPAFMRKNKLETDSILIDAKSYHRVFYVYRIKHINILKGG